MEKQGREMSCYGGEQKSEGIEWNREGIVTGSRAMEKISRAGIREGIALSRCGTDMHRHGDALIG